MKNRIFKEGKTLKSDQDLVSSSLLSCLTTVSGPPQKDKTQGYEHYGISLVFWLSIDIDIHLIIYNKMPNYRNRLPCKSNNRFTSSNHRLFGFIKITKDALFLFCCRMNCLCQDPSSKFGTPFRYGSFHLMIR